MRLRGVGLSPKGVAAFQAVCDAVTLPQLAALRKANTPANANGPPVELIRALRRGGLERSIDSGLALPNVDACSQPQLVAWWKMHVAGVAALTNAEALQQWMAACRAFEGTLG